MIVLQLHVFPKDRVLDGRRHSRHSLGPGWPDRRCQCYHSLDVLEGMSSEQKSAILPKSCSFCIGCFSL